MSLPFFYEPILPATGSQVTLSEETSRHCTQVLRMKTGDALQLTDGKGRLCKAKLVQEDKKKSLVRIEENTLTPSPGKQISVAMALLKNASRFEWFLEKATEIGITEIQPLITKRTEHVRFRHDRLQNILLAAMLQSQQVWLPVLHEPVPFAKCVSSSQGQLKLVAHCEEGKKRLIKDLPQATSAQILIGPEGDFTPDEIQLALEQGYLPVSLGETRLRAETAGIVASALLMNR